MNDEINSEVKEKKTKAPKKPKCEHIWKKIENKTIRCKKCRMIKSI